MIIAFLSRFLRSIYMIGDAIHDGAALHRKMSHRHPGLTGLPGHRNRLSSTLGVPVRCAHPRV